MTDSPPAPGHDQIIVTAPDGRQVCHTREHTRLGCLAEVTVAFGELGTATWDNDALWPQTWSHSYPLCRECWEGTCQVAQGRRHGLTITDTRPPRLS